MIFDTSSIYKAVELNCIEKLQGEKTLDLSLYELGNVIWKYVARNKISIEEGNKLIDILIDVISLMNIIQIGLNKNAYEISANSNISYYDAVYIYSALSLEETIISEDRKLIEIANKYGIKSYTIEEYL